MRDYEELVETLRLEADGFLMDDVPDMLMVDTLNDAADAIEELTGKTGRFKWIKIESRPMTEEERKEWSERIGYDIEYEEAIIYASELPTDGQEVLVCSKWGRVWIDTFSNDPDYGVGFEENGDMDGVVAWMPLPEPPKEDDDA